MSPKWCLFLPVYYHYILQLTFIFGCTFRWWFWWSILLLCGLLAFFIISFTSFLVSPFSTRWPRLEDIKTDMQVILHGNLKHVGFYHHEYKTWRTPYEFTPLYIHVYIAYLFGWFKCPWWTCFQETVLQFKMTQP